jgi:ATP-dependent RNA helicase RhlE
VRALVLVPTRELAAQVGETMRSLAQHLPERLKIAIAFGGVSINPQMMSLRGGADIVVATPGRLLDLVEHNALKLGAVSMLVLDEADRLFDLGFAEELGRILALLPAQRQNLLFSATFPPAIQSLADGMLRDPAVIDVQGEPGTEPNIVQRVIEVDANRRTQLLRHLLKENEWERVLVFVATQHSAQTVAEKLYKNGVYAVPFHGDIAQGTRTGILAQFKESRWDVVIATDLAARGIDIAQLPVVINYDLPRSPTDYIHRIGRTGRAGESGLAISFVSASTEAHFRLIEKRQGLSLPRERIEGFEPTEVAVPPVDASGSWRYQGQAAEQEGQAARRRRRPRSRANPKRTTDPRQSLHRVVDLVPRDPQIAQLLAHPQMRGVRGIAVERCLAVEFAVEHHVAGVGDAA